MGLFSFFKRNDKLHAENTIETPTIPENLFVEKAEPTESFKINLTGNGVADLEAIYNYLQQDYETRGYEDALTNAEESYRKDNVELIYLDLQIIIARANSFYSGLISQLDYHIDTRTRSGLVDLVEELKTKKNAIQNQVVQVKEIEDQSISRTGLCKRAELSYTRGFHKGLVAITQSQILK